MIYYFLGLIISIIFGFLIIPFFKRINFFQSISTYLNERHNEKQGTPTMGGIIFIVPVLIIIFTLLIFKKIKLDFTIITIIISFISFGYLGFKDDFLKIKYHNNKGLSIYKKFFYELIITLIIYIIITYEGYSTIINIANFNIDLKFLYGPFILFLYASITNAVNITDGLDGLCSGICLMLFLTYGVIAYNSPYIIGYKEIAIFCFIIAGSLSGFLLFNFYPAKIFMGDLGSLALGSAIASIIVLLKREFSIVLIGFIFVLETLSSLLQILFIKFFKRKIFRKAPFHHNLEEYNLKETEIIKIFYFITLGLAIIYLLYFFKGIHRI